MAFPIVDLEKCIGEGDCEEICPADPNVFSIIDDKSHVVNPDACIECGLCVDECPEEAIVLNED